MKRHNAGERQAGLGKGAGCSLAGTSPSGGCSSLCEGRKEEAVSECTVDP